MIWNEIEKKLEKHKDSFVKDGKVFCTYREILDKTICLSNQMQKHIKKGQKCVILCKWQINEAIAILCCWKNGYIPVPLSVNYGNEHCKKIIDTVTADCIIVDNDVLVCDWGYDYFNLQDCVYKTACKREKGTENDGYKFALIMYTSGTTGSPKGAVLSEKAILNNVNGIIQYFVMSDEDSILISRPLYHCAVLIGEFLTALFQGANIIFYSDLYNPFKVIELMGKASVFCGTPTLLRQISQIVKRNKGNNHVRMIAISGECIKSKTAETIREAFPKSRIFNVYGLTEAGPRVSFLPSELFDKKPESVGRGLLNTSIQIRDDNNEILNNCEKGNIWVKSNSLMLLYYNNEEDTKNKLVNGWLNTGDVGYKDEDGDLYILGRSDDMIIKAGMNIYPKEIENYVDEIEGIKECMAFPVEISDGETKGIGLKVVCETDSLNSYEIMKEKICQCLPKYALPNKIEFVNELPKNISGKMLRRIERL